MDKMANLKLGGIYKFTNQSENNNLSSFMTFLKFSHFKASNSFGHIDENFEHNFDQSVLEYLAQEQNLETWITKPLELFQMKDALHLFEFINHRIDLQEKVKNLSNENFALIQIISNLLHCSKRPILIAGEKLELSPNITKRLVTALAKEVEHKNRLILITSTFPHDYNEMIHGIISRQTSGKFHIKINEAPQEKKENLTVSSQKIAA